MIRARGQVACTSMLIAALLSGCATFSETYTADGKKGYSISCSGLALHWGMCYERAGELCKERGFEILEKSGDQGFVATGGYAGSATSRSMIIQCKGQ